MTITEKAKEKLDEASKEIKTAVDGLAKEVADISETFRDSWPQNGCGRNRW